jgi:hypothetical protein
MDWSLLQRGRSRSRKSGREMVLPRDAPAVGALFEHIDHGSTIDEFVEWFPSVTREQVHDVLAFALISLEQRTILV